MKRLIPIVALLFAVNAGAQNCESIVLPFFGNDTARMANYPTDKLMFRCFYSQASFYESDTIPAGVEVFNISDVHEAYGTGTLPQNYVVDLTTLSYYAYNFRSFQLRYPHGNMAVCFATPSSTHPYLVLRSLDDANAMAERMLQQYYIDLENE